MKVLLLILIISTIAATFGTSWTFNRKSKVRSDDDIEQQQWDDYKKTYHKNYNETEGARRFELFKKRKAEIDAHNELYDQGKRSYSEGLNQFSDCTQDEIDDMGGSIVAELPDCFNYP